MGGFNWGPRGKGLDIFIELARRRPDRTFVAFGAGHQGLHRQLARLDKRLANFHFGGALHRGVRHRTVFKQARLAVLPSRIPDTFPRTIVESLSKGTPVLGIRCGALPEMIGADGGLAAQDLDEMANFLDTEPDYERCFGHARRFHIDREVQGLLDVSQRIGTG